MDNRNTREDINFSSNSDPNNDVDTGWYLSGYKKGKDKAAGKEEIKECPECGSKSLIRDYSKAEIFCEVCGLVISENIVDPGSEWRAFDSEQISRRARVGASMTYRIHDEKKLKQREKRVNDRERSKLVEKERNARYERVLKQYDSIISSITESDDLKKNLRKRVFSPPASLFLTSDVDECVERIRGLLNNEWKDDFLRYFEKNYWKKEADSNLKIQRGGAKSLTQGEGFLFSWSKVPGSDSKRLRKFLMDDFDVSWVENADINKTDDGKTIFVSAGKNSVEITLNVNVNAKKDKITFKIEDRRTDDFTVRRKDGERNIYKRGIMQDTTLLAFYYFLVEITIGSFREFVEKLIKKRDSNISLVLEWVTMTAIIETLFKKYKNILVPLIKRDSCYFLGKQAESDLRERNAHEWFDIKMISPWKIDPKFRCFNVEKLYTLFEKIKEDETEPKRGRPSEGIIERQKLVGMVMVSAHWLFNRICHSIYKKTGFKPQKKEGLYGACFYVAAINKLIHDIGNIDPKVNMRFLRIYLQTCVFPVKSLKHWADFFNVSERTFRNRLNELKEFDSDLGDKIKAVNIFRSSRLK
jgi:hypothetical protein